MSPAYLLDTQTLLVWRAAVGAVPNHAKRLLTGKSARLFFSVASVWEICIKRSLGKLELGIETREFVESALSAGVTLLEIRPEHLYRAEDLPWHHHDPFDRLIVAQALVENLPIIGSDPKFSSYGVEVIWKS